MNKKENKSLTLPFPPALASTFEVLATVELEWISAKVWWVDAQWDLPRRSLDDVFLFVPLEGSIEVDALGRRATVKPGQVWWVDEGVEHSARLAQGVDSLKVVALHVHVRDRHHVSLLAQVESFIQPLSHPQAWFDRLHRMAVLDGPEARWVGDHLRTELRSLLLEALEQGCLSMPKATRYDPRVEELIRWISSQRQGIPSLEQCAEFLGLTPVHTRNLFRQNTGQTPHHYILEQRLRTARRELHLAKSSVAAVARRHGFASPQQFHRAFKNRYQCTPLEDREAFAGQL